MEGRLKNDIINTMYLTLLQFRIRIFSYKTMKPLAVLSYHRDSVTSIDFGKENKSWLIAASDINISLWNIY
jgi:WD40 repeat protein